MNHTQPQQQNNRSRDNNRISSSSSNDRGELFNRNDAFETDDYYHRYNPHQRGRDDVNKSKNFHRPPSSSSSSSYNHYHQGHGYQRQRGNNEDAAGYYHQRKKKHYDNNFNYNMSSQLSSAANNAYKQYPRGSPSFRSNYGGYRGDRNRHYNDNVVEEVYKGFNSSKRHQQHHKSYKNKNKNHHHRSPEFVATLFLERQQRDYNMTIDDPSSMPPIDMVKDILSINNSADMISAADPSKIKLIHTAVKTIHYHQSYNRMDAVDTDDDAAAASTVCYCCMVIASQEVLEHFRVFKDYGLRLKFVKPYYAPEGTNPKVFHITLCDIYYFDPSITKNRVESRLHEIINPFVRAEWIRLDDVVISLFMGNESTWYGNITFDSKVSNYVIATIYSWIMFHSWDLKHHQLLLGGSSSNSVVGDSTKTAAASVTSNHTEGSDHHNQIFEGKIRIRYDIMPSSSSSVSSSMTNAAAAASNNQTITKDNLHKNEEEDTEDPYDSNPDNDSKPQHIHANNKEEEVMEIEECHDI